MGSVSPSPRRFHAAARSERGDRRLSCRAEGLARLSVASRRRGKPLVDELTQAAEIMRKGANAFGKLFGRHCVLVQHPAKLFFIKVDLSRSVLDVGRRQFALERALVARKLVEKLRRYGQAVAAGERFDLPGIAERGAHHHGLETIRLVIGVDLAHRRDAWIGHRRGGAAATLDMPIEYAPDEGRDKKGAGVRAGDRLSERKDQRHIAIDAFL